VDVEHSDAYCLLADELSQRGVNVENVRTRLLRQEVETPSWGYGNSGTRFQVFPQPGVPRTPFEKLDDAALVHKLTGICPAVAIHIPWDKVDDFSELQEHARHRSMRIGAINPNVFQEHAYKFGSITNEDATIRQSAVEHLLECVEIGTKVGSHVQSLWFADGTNYPGQGDFRRRKAWQEECLAIMYRAMPPDMRMLIEYKFYEPGFYHTDLADWGMAYATSLKLGDRAQVLVDLGHHAQGVNVEHIVAYLLAEQKLGGFHFNNRKYGDDDLMVGTINPMELFLIFNELVAEEERLNASSQIAYMIDQSHNVEAKIPAMILSVLNVQQAYAKALLVNRKELACQQAAGDVIGAHRVLVDAFETDVRPLCASVREELGAAVDPLLAFRASGYAQRVADERKEGQAMAWI